MPFVAPLENLKSEVLERFYRDRWYGHQVLFQHRHPERSASVHRDLVAALNDPFPRKSIEGFRGLGKSTYVEETAVFKGIFKEYRFLLIVGASLSRACERLYSIKIELQNNEGLTSLTGSLVGQIWREDKIELMNGTVIQAMGRDQSMTGIKHNDVRPDAVIIDDVEDPEEIRSDAERRETWNWFLKVLIPALDHPDRSWIRHLGTRRGTGSLPERLEAAGWPCARFPIEVRGPGGERVPSWPAKFPLDVIDQRRELYRGDLATYMQEYMCVAESEESRVFRQEDFRFERRDRSWHAVYAMYDPARTTHRGSATTGKAVWSWVGRRLVVWELKAERWSPDEIIQDILDTNERYAPVYIGVEKTGLAEWIMQPLRQAARGRILPLRGVEAPRGKLDFIRSLQPYFRGGEVTLVGHEGEYRDTIPQFLSFPRGAIDAPNALAYAVISRPGQPVYDSFSDDNIQGQFPSDPEDTVPSLAASSDGMVTAALLVRRRAGRIEVLADFVREGSPADTVLGIAEDAGLIAGSTRQTSRTVWGEGEDLYKLPLVIPATEAVTLDWVLGPEHFDHYRNVGLRAAIRSIPASAKRGGEVATGRARLADLMVAKKAGESLFSVAERARWTLRALSGGYAYQLSARGQPAASPEAGIYRVLMEALESFAAAGMAHGTESGTAEAMQPIAYTRSGVAYRSAIPQR